MVGLQMCDAAGEFGRHEGVPTLSEISGSEKKEKHELGRWGAN